MPKDLINQVRALMRVGYSESMAYAIAVNGYKRRHGHAPVLHHKHAIGVMYRKRDETSELKNLLLLLDNDLRNGNLR